MNRDHFFWSMFTSLSKFLAAKRGMRNASRLYAFFRLTVGKSFSAQEQKLRPAARKYFTDNQYYSARRLLLAEGWIRRDAANGIIYLNGLSFFKSKYRVSKGCFKSDPTLEDISSDTSWFTFVCESACEGLVYGFSWSYLHRKQKESGDTPRSLGKSTTQDDSFVSAEVSLRLMAAECNCSTGQAFEIRLEATKRGKCAIQRQSQLVGYMTGDQFLSFLEKESNPQAYWRDHGGNVRKNLPSIMTVAKRSKYPPIGTGSFLFPTVEVGRAGCFH